jgi:hypothetical protein
MVQACSVFIFGINSSHMEGPVEDHCSPRFVAICERLFAVFRPDFLNCFKHFDDYSKEVCYSLHIYIAN